GDGATGATDTKILQCRYVGVSGGGDGFRFIGAAGNLINRFWVSEHCQIESAGRYGVSINEYCQLGWVTDNYITGCGTNEINITASAAASIDLVKVCGNHLTHTASNGIAVTWSGDATNRINRSHFCENTIVGGSVVMGGMKRCQVQSNDIASGAYAGYTDAVLKITGAVDECQFQRNIIDRQTGMGVGYVVEILDDGTHQPQKIQLQNNGLIQEVTAAGLIHTRSATNCQIGPNVASVTNAGATSVIAILIEAIATGASDLMQVVGNIISAAAGTWQYGIEFFSNGGNIIDVLAAGNVISNVDTGVRLQGTGAGLGGFTGIVGIMGSTLDGATASWSKSSTTVYPRIGGNASTFGANIFSDAGTPAGNVTARVGSLYLQTDGGAGTTLWVKESGTGTAGWVGK
ncbi:MAG TPA: hypothetical protein VMV18_11465, partial [bacterium]|nr:hypothetical protein [bacterium]